MLVISDESLTFRFATIGFSSVHLSSDGENISPERDGLNNSCNWSLADCESELRISIVELDKSFTESINLRNSSAVAFASSRAR